MTCEHCPSRPRCACPYGPAKCVAEACECDAHCPCRVDGESPSESPEPEPKPKPKRWPPRILCGPVGVIVLVAIVVVGMATSILWWDDTPLVAFAVLIILTTFVIWTVMATAFFGRWGAEVVGVVPYPTWLWPLFLLLAAVSSVLGAVALVDGGETRAGLVLLVVAVIFARLGFFGQWILLAPWRGLLPLIVALVGISLVVGLIAVIDADRSFSPWLVILAILPALLVIGLPMIVGRAQLGALTPIGGIFPAMLWLMPILAFVVVTIMALGTGLIPSDPYGELMPLPSEPPDLDDPGPGPGTGEENGGENRTENDPARDGNPAPANDPAQTQTTDDEKEDQPLTDAQTQQTYRLAMSDGASFPIYRLDLDGGEPLAIVLPNPDPCWVLQYDAGIAGQLGECSDRWIGDVVPDPATILYRNDTQIVVLLTFEEQLVVTDFAAIQGGTTAMGFEEGLADQFFVTLTPIGNSLVIGDDTFQQ